MFPYGNKSACDKWRKAYSHLEKDLIATEKEPAYRQFLETKNNYELAAYIGVFLSLAVLAASGVIYHNSRRRADEEIEQIEQEMRRLYQSETSPELAHLPDFPGEDLLLNQCVQKSKTIH